MCVCVCPFLVCPLFVCVCFVCPFCVRVFFACMFRGCVWLHLKLSRATALAGVPPTIYTMYTVHVGVWYRTANI